MSEQDGIQSSTKRRRRRQTNTGNQENGRQAPAPHRPTNDNSEAWKVYWKAQGQSWRTEPEIDEERQKYLAERRAIKADVKRGIYPFKDIEPKLNRADIEWLLATHENGRGPVDWSDGSQRKRDGLDLRGADLSQENLSGLPLACMQGGLALGEWLKATEEQRNMAAVRMQGAILLGAQMQGAILLGAQMQGADLGWAQMQGAGLGRTRMQGASLYMAQMQGAELREAKLDGVNFAVATLSDEKYGPALLADVRWGDVNLAPVDWTPVKILGDERLARLTKKVDDYQIAVRANRQLGVVLRGQGLNEEADHFAYRAQLLQRIVWRYQRRWLKFILSWFLYFIAGYGYRPIRSVIWYITIVCGFALAYHILGQLSLFPPDAFIYSLTSFHGRGFFPGLEHRTSLHDPLIMLAAVEAVVGLFIEISFIATFTQRFFGR